MPLESPLVVETKRRLIHLRSMPETPLRRREILSLERVLETVSRQPLKTSGGRRPSRLKELEEEDEPEPIIKTPLRRVEREDGRKKVILRAARKEQPEEKTDIKAEERALKERMDNTLSVLGLTHRGMS
jgi:hypothetical protein